MNPSIDQLKETFTNLAFIHQKLMGSTFYPEDFVQADKSIKFLTAMANQITEDIQALEQAQASVVAVEAEATPEVPAE